MKNLFNKKVGLLGLLILLNSFLFSVKYNLKFHQFLSLQAAIPSQFIQPWIKKVERESNGEVAIKHYPSMQLGGKPPSLVNQVKDGTVDFIWTLMGYTPGRFPKSEAFELPFLTTTSEATSQAFYEYYEKNLQDEFKDYKIITVHTHGPGILHSQTPIYNLDNLKGKKIRGPTKVTTSLLKTLGAVPIGMPVPQVPEFLANGILDGTLIPWGVSLSLKTSEIVQNHTIVYGKQALYTATFMIAMNKKTYTQLPFHLKKVIDNNSGLATAAWVGRITAQDDQKGLLKAKHLGNNIITLSPQETQKWKSLSQMVINDWIKKMEQKGYPGKRLVQNARKLITKYSNKNPKISKKYY